MHNAHTHARRIFTEFPLCSFFFLFSIRFSFPAWWWCVCVLKYTDLVFRGFLFFFSLLPPPLHRLKPRQRTLTAKSIRSTKGRTFDDDTLLADSRGFLTTTTSEGRCSRGFCCLGVFSSVSVGWGVSIEGGECLGFLLTIMGDISNHNCALYLVDSI